MDKIPESSPAMTYFDATTKNLADPSRNTLRKREVGSEGVPAAYVVAGSLHGTGTLCQPCNTRNDIDFTAY